MRNDTVHVRWTDVQAGDTLADGRRVVATDVRASVNVCRLDDGSELRVWRAGAGSTVEVRRRPSTGDKVVLGASIVAAVAAAWFDAMLTVIERVGGAL